MELTGIFREFAQVAGPAAVGALWQSVVLTAGLAVALRCAPRISAADRFRIWSAAFAVLVALPFLPLLGSIHLGSIQLSPLGGSAVAVSAGSASASPWINLDPRWSLAIAGLWLALSGWRAVDLAVHSLRLRRLWRNAAPIENGTNYVICATRDLDRPSVIGFWAPRILIPDWLLKRLSPGELEQVVLHEAEHLRRHDDWTNLLQKMALVLFPVNPALLWVERRLCREREMACDEGVVRRTRAPRAYAACLASLAQRGLEHRAEALSLGAWQRRPELVERVNRILRRGPALHPAAARALVVVAGCGLLAGSMGFARCPQLVGFSASQPAQLAQAGEGDVVIDPGASPVSAPMLTAAGAGEGYRAVEAMARIPSRAEASAARMRRRPRAVLERTVAGGERRANAQPGQLAAAAERRALPVVAGELPQQWVVLTAWEQIETTARPAEQGAQRASVAVANASGAEGDALVPTTRQITVTRFYLTIYSAGAAKSKAGAKVGAKYSGGPVMQQLPLHEGWLVIQL